jgi:tagaturonate reductase
MQLSKQTVGLVSAKEGLDIPSTNYFSLPEKVLQFGTGVLLRGLPDYFIDKANKQGLFNGRVVLIKSTAAGSADEFNKQDGLYTLCVKGIEDGKLKEENIINASVSRVLSAASEWDKILECMVNPAIEIIISNTTEVGLDLVKETIEANPPSSYPAKLLALLYKRYMYFNGATDKGMVIIPTELIPDNGKKLLGVLKELSVYNQLDNTFISWLENSNHFCSSLVDRIVPGKLAKEKHKQAENDFGYEDELMIMSELYCLWAIESSDKKVSEILSFSKADEGVVIAPDIFIFRELKLRLLNGAHTYSCGLAHLAGFRLVKDAMNDGVFAEYITKLMLDEIVSAITGSGITKEMAIDFSKKVLDRFRNPYIEHAWLSITLQYSSKMKMRNVPALLKYYNAHQRVPAHMALGFAAHILFMRCEKNNDGKYVGKLNDSTYIINDDQAGAYAERWGKLAIEDVVHETLADLTLWGNNLSALPGFEKAVLENLQLIIGNGALAAINKIIL